MPFASMSKVTSICGTPRGAGRMSSSRKRASTRLSAASSRSPCSTTTSTAVWLSSAVREDLGAAGRDRGVALDDLGHHAAQRLQPQRQRGDVEQHDVLDLALDDRRPGRRRRCATTSSGLTVMFGSLPPVSRRTSSCTAGMRVEPPTRITSSMSSAVILASAIACSTGPRHRSIRSAVSCSNVERISVAFRCLGPEASAVMNGRLTASG